MGALSSCQATSSGEAFILVVDSTQPGSDRVGSQTRSGRIEVFMNCLADSEYIGWVVEGGVVRVVCTVGRLEEAQTCPQVLECLFWGASACMGLVR
jgi:hypothetical protein